MHVLFGGRSTVGASEKDMVCSFCYRFFVLTEGRWSTAEKKPCPYCGSRETTPMLGKYDGAVPVLVRDGKGGFL